MKATTKTNVSKGILNVVRTKPYEVFFGILIFLVVAPVMTTIGALMVVDSTIPLFWNMVAIYLSTLMAVTLMSNLGDPKPSAGEVFWLWIFVSVGITFLAVFGYYEIMFFRLFS